jgi:nucleotide-binding universal stress UspA family protein
MFGRVLVGYTETEQGHDALALGQALARANGAEMEIVTARAERGETLAQMALAHRAEVVVLGSTHYGPVGRVFPGATVERLLGESPCAVAVAPPGFGLPAAAGSGWLPLSGDVEDTGIRVIGVGYDGSEAAAEALRIATELAQHNGASLRVYTVARQYPVLGNSHVQSVGVPSEAQALQELLHDAVSALPGEVRALPVFRRGLGVAEELLEAAKLGVDLLVLGSRRGGPIRRRLHHSVTNSVLQMAECPVLISPSVAIPRVAAGERSALAAGLAS